MERKIYRNFEEAVDFTFKNMDKTLGKLAQFESVSVGQIVQLTPECKNRGFVFCFMVVTEVKSWGVKGYVQSLGESGELGGQAYYRAEWGEFEKTGGFAPYIVL